MDGKKTTPKGTEKRRTLMKKTFGKILGAFLCLGMVLGLMSSQALQVFAEGETTPNYLTFTAEEAGSTLSFTWNTEESVEISRDSGENWTTYQT